MEQGEFENIKDMEMETIHQFKTETKSTKIDRREKKILILLIVGGLLICFSLIGYFIHDANNQIKLLETAFQAESIHRTKQFTAKIDALTYQLVIRDYQIQEQKKNADPTVSPDPLSTIILRSEIVKSEQVEKQKKLNQQRTFKQVYTMGGREVPGENMLHDHENQPWIEPTLGRPTKDTKFNFTEVAKEHYYEFEKKMENLYKPYTDTDCETVRIGSTNDGGYILCKNLIHRAKGLINIGIMGYDEFGCSLTTQYNFLNFQYDCTDKPGDGACLTNSGRNRQNLFCLSDQTEGFEVNKYSTLQDMIDYNKLSKKNIIIKMDSEGSEWGALRTLPLRYLEYVDQLLIQSHFYKYYKMYWGYADIMQKLSEYFVPITYNENNGQCFKQKQGAASQKHYYTAACFQNTLINKKLIKIKSENRSYKRHPLNPLVFPQLPYRCEMTD